VNTLPRAPLSPLAKKHAALGWDPCFVDRSPWLESLRSGASAFVGLPDWPSIEHLTEAAEAARRALAPDEPPVRFVEAPPKTKRRGHAPSVLDELYDVRIARRGEIPTRPKSAHDFYNALRWITFPRAKRRLHARQCRALVARVEDGATRLPDRRTREQDALTVFDEGGAIVTPGGLVLFGHALLEHVHGSDAPIRAATVRVEAKEDEIDERLAARLDDAGAFTTPGAFGSVVLHANGTVEAIE
jgi:hypothetical protein